MNMRERYRGRQITRHIFLHENHISYRQRIRNKSSIMKVGIRVSPGSSQYIDAINRSS